MSTVDNLIALKVLYMLVTPYNKTEAFKTGVVDETGKVLVKAKDRTTDQANSYDYLVRLVFNLKRLIGMVPGGKTQIGSIVAAYYLIKECHDSKIPMALVEELFADVLLKINENQITLIEESLVVEEFMDLFEDGEGGVPANATGPQTSTDIPVIRIGKNGRKFGTFNADDEMFRRFSKGKKKFSQWKEYLNPTDEKHNEIYNYVKKNPKGVVILKNGEQMKAIRFNRHGGGTWHKIKRASKKPAIQIENLQC